MIAALFLAQNFKNVTSDFWESGHWRYAAFEKTFDEMKAWSGIMKKTVLASLLVRARQFD